MMHQELALHDLLRSGTSVPVAEIIAFDEDTFERDFMMMERLSGQPISDAANLDYKPEVMHEYGMREFTVRDPDGYLIAFAQDVNG